MEKYKKVHFFILFQQYFFRCIEKSIGGKKYIKSREYKYILSTQRKKYTKSILFCTF